MPELILEDLLEIVQIFMYTKVVNFDNLKNLIF